MPPEIAPHERLKQKTVLACGVHAVLIGALILTVRIVEIGALDRNSVHAPIEGNSALLFILSGISLWSTSRQLSGGTWLRFIGGMSALAVGAIALPALVHNAESIDSGIRQFSFGALPISVSTSFPGRIAPTTAVVFSLIGVSLLFIHIGFARTLAVSLAVLAFLITALCCLSVLYGANSFQFDAPFSFVALHSVLALLIVTAGLLASSSKRMVELLASDSVGGMVVRRLLPVVLISAIAGWLVLAGMKAGWFGAEFGLALFSLLNIILFSVFIVWATTRVQAADDQRSQAVEKLRESERIYRAIGESINYGVWVSEPDGRNIYASPSFLELVGITQQECSDFGWGEVLHPDEAAWTIEAWKECVRTRGRWHVEHRFRGKDGKWHPMLAVGTPVFDDQNNLICWAGINLDISSMKTAQQALQQALDELELRVRDRTAELLKVNQRLQLEIEEHLATEVQLRDHNEEMAALLEVLPVPILIAHDPDCCMITGNRATYEMVQLPKETNLSISVPEDEKPALRFYQKNKEVNSEDLPMQQAAATGEVVRNSELELVLDDGTVRSIFGTAAPLFDSDHRVRGCVAAFMDITERRLLGASLRDTEEKYQSVVESLAEGIVIQALDGSITASNNRASEILGLSREQIDGRTSLDPNWGTVHDDGSPFPGEEHPAMVALRTGNPVFNSIMGVRKPSGDYTWITVNAVSIRARDGSLQGVVTSFHDITESRRLHELVRASLLEKEVLLKEIHHRVKNNLQIISTLLDLQSGYSNDPQVWAMFKESRGRVKSMALIHERLYRSHDMARVNFTEYIQQLTGVLCRTYNMTGHIDLKLNVEIPPFPIDIAIPCGLLVNELMSNCLKHAFTKSGGGCIWVSLSQIDETKTLIVADNGVGFPAGTDYHTTKSFGLRLVNTLVEQLDGEIEITNESGAKVTVRFPINKN